MTQIAPLQVKFDVDTSGLKGIQTAARNAGSHVKTGLGRAGKEGGAALTAGAKTAGRNLTGAMSKAGKDAGGAFTSGLKGMLHSVGPALITGAGIVASLAVAKGAVDRLAATEVVNAQTVNVIKSMGNQAGVSAAQVNNLATELERTTGTQSDVIKEGQNLLLTFGNVKNAVGEGNDVFDQTTKVMVDMSRAMGSDVKGSAIMLGKALNDPILGMGALAEVGVSFSAQEKAQVIAMQNSGNMVAAQAVILKSMNAQFGGSGEAYVATFSGILESVRTELGNIGETIMGTSMPGLKELATKGLGHLRAFSENLPAIMEKASAVLGPILKGMGATFGAIGSALKPLLASFGGMSGAMSPLGAVIQGLLPILPKLISQIGPVFMDAISKVMPMISKLIGIIGPVLGNIIATVLPIIMNLITTIGPVLMSVISTVLPMIAELLAILGPALMDIIAQIMPVIGQLLTVLGPVLMNVIGQVMPIIGDLIKIVGPVLGEVINQVMPIIMELVEVLGPILGDIIGTLAPILMGVVSALAQFLVPALQVVGPLLLGVGQFFGKIIEAVYPFLKMLGLVAIAATPTGAMASAGGWNAAGAVGAAAGTTTNNYNVSAQGLTVDQVSKDAARRGRLAGPLGG